MPIPVYTQDAPPTTAAKPSGSTPQTAAPPTAPSTAPAPAPMTTTATPSSNPSSYPPAQPAHGIIPAPTNAYGEPTAPASNYTPLPPPTPTTQSTQSPPAPQPGAVPVPPGGHARSTSALPPPPKVGEKYIPPPPAQQAQQTMPPQFGYAPLNAGVAYQPQAASRGTATSTMPSTTFPSQLSYTSPAVDGGADARLEHPPGYHQNLYAANQSPQARNATLERRDGEDTGYHRAGAMDAMKGKEESVWETAKGWAWSAGKKVAEGEAEIWRRINGEK